MSGKTRAKKEGAPPKTLPGHPYCEFLAEIPIRPRLDPTVPLPEEWSMVNEWVNEVHLRNIYDLDVKDFVRHSRISARLCDKSLKPITPYTDAAGRPSASSGSAAPVSAVADTSQTSAAATAAASSESPESFTTCLSKYRHRRSLTVDERRLLEADIIANQINIHHLIEQLNGMITTRHRSSMHHRPNTRILRSTCASNRNSQVHIARLYRATMYRVTDVLQLKQLLKLPVRPSRVRSKEGGAV